MELQEVSKESKEAEDLGASKVKLEAKTEDKGDPDKETKDVKEEAEPDHYSKLQNPQEDVYAEAFYCDASALKKPDKQTAEGNTRLYKAVCIILTIICVILLLAIVALCVKLQNGSAVCPVTEDSTICSEVECRDLYGTPPPRRANSAYRCQRCPMGWLMFDQQCFYMSTTRLNWDDSQKNCSASGGSLAVIHTKKVQDFLTKKGNLPYWIGLKQNQAKKWTWSDNTTLRQSYWADSTEDKPCGILNSEDPPEKNWKKAPCTSSAYFICQLQLTG